MNEQGTTTRLDRALTIPAIVVAVVALGVAIFALTRTHSSQPASALALAGEVRSLKTELATAKDETAKAQGDLTKITTCLPEVMGEIQSLSVETGYREVGGERYLTSAFLHTGNQISTYCQSTLERASH